MIAQSYLKIFLGGNLTPAIDKLTADALHDGRESAVRSELASVADREAEGPLHFISTRYIIGIYYISRYLYLKFLKLIKKL